MSRKWRRRWASSTSRLSHGENYGLWGNFKIGYTDNELAQVDRGLYGANAALRVRSHHELRRAALSPSTASPPSPARSPSYEEFRGTGGSLYFLHHQDILTGSERVRIELRDKDSGIVTGVVNLRPALDYDIDYLQGRVLLSEPLLVDRRRQPAGAQQRRERRRGLSRRAL